ncbi:hypothetical protein ED733_007698 [Metarhizium rileyi]|uniref:Uncharacterized protein n=1 Tax=Metarhizium rileyi (strain RCEF 4871) TaxID=1649241 RepID=A0A5C6GPE5_METRR|nr:hypothetical protein ED733_007698 [Metarhizium rileyi]
MDPEADADAAAAMAAAMGFSTFGAQDRPQKKRRYNAAVDAATSAPQPPTGSRATPTGSNLTPLGDQGLTSSKKPGNQANTEANDENEDEPSEESAPPQPSPNHGLPARPAPGMGFGKPPPARLQSHQHTSPAESSGVWYEGYYDNTSNENPWERLEKDMGLETKGTWVSKQAHPAQGV